jgi:hypothetical protein
MVKTFDAGNLENIPRSSLSIGENDFSGDLIDGGTITNFGSTGIKDNATQQTLLVENDKITVKSISIKSIDSDFTIRGDVKIYGILDAGFVRTTELITNQIYEKQYLEFAHGESGTNMGTGLLWPSDTYNKQFVLMPGPDRFFSTENIEIAKGRNFMIGGATVVSMESLGSSIVNSSLKSVGTLRELNISGPANFNDFVFYNPVNNRFSLGQDQPSALFTVYDYPNNVEIVIDADKNSRGRIGTFNTKPLDIITDDQVRISIDEQGHITFGHELRDSTIIRAYGKFSVNVKNPTEAFEVGGNMRVGGKLQARGTEPPTQGAYVQGDVIWNNNPLPQGYIGWVCVKSGTPGGWKTFGQISP